MKATSASLTTKTLETSISWMLSNSSDVPPPEPDEPVPDDS
ncbi:hypothetical protein [Methanosalsum zhilinae]|nr:hypothetical protein [Methanosalsum zhilinae]